MGSPDPEVGNHSYRRIQAEENKQLYLQVRCCCIDGSCRMGRILLLSHFIHKVSPEYAAEFSSQHIGYFKYLKNATNIFLRLKKMPNHVQMLFRQYI